MSTQSKRNFFYRVLCGAFIGISIIAPGISGSIMAVMMGIYDELIDIISNPFRNFKKNIIYLLPMCIGAGLSMVLCLKLLKFVFEYYPTPGYLLFISLIAGSFPAVLQEAKADKFKVRYIFGALIAFAFALTIGFLAKNDVAVTVDTASAGNTARMVYLSASGAVAGIAGMIPGMSVSMILMMLNVYEPLLNAAAGFDVITIFPVGMCFVVGMILCSKLTKFIFRKYHGIGYFAVLGFMSGSIISIFPGLPNGLLDWVLSIIAVGTGIGISYIFKILGKKINTSNNLQNE